MSNFYVLPYLAMESDWADSFITPESCMYPPKQKTIRKFYIIWICSLNKVCGKHFVCWMVSLELPSWFQRKVRTEINMSPYVIKIIVRNASIQFREQYVFVRDIVFSFIGWFKDNLLTCSLTHWFKARVWFDYKSRRESINHCCNNFIPIKGQICAVTLEHSALILTCTVLLNNQPMVELPWKLLWSSCRPWEGSSCSAPLCLQRLCPWTTI